jgi:hypothetical protein
MSFLLLLMSSLQQKLENRAEHVLPGSEGSRGKEMGVGGRRKR